MVRLINNLYPGGKIFFVVSLIFSGLIVNEIKHYILILAIFMLVSILLKLFAEYVLSVLKVLLVLSLIMFLMVVITTEGENLLFKLGFLYIYKEGLTRALLMILRISVVCSGIILITRIVTVEDVTMVLEKIGVPALGVFVIQSTITMIPQLKNKMSVIMDAQASRGMKFSGSLFTRVKKMIPLLFPLILSSFYDNEEKTLVLISRGIELPGPKFRLNDRIFTSKDLVIVILSILIIILSIYGRLG